MIGSDDTQHRTMEEQMQLDLDNESLTIYIDEGDDQEFLPIVYWHIDEVIEDENVAFYMLQAMQLFYTDRTELLNIMGIKQT